MNVIAPDGDSSEFSEQQFAKSLIRAGIPEGESAIYAHAVGNRLGSFRNASIPTWTIARLEQSLALCRISRDRPDAVAAQVAAWATPDARRIAARDALGVAVV